MLKLAMAALLAAAAGGTALAVQDDGTVCGAPQYGAPDDFIRASYERLQGSGTPPPPAGVIYTDRLNRLFDDGIERIGFGFWVDGQDWEIGDIDVTARRVHGRSGRQVVRARFTNFGEPRDLSFFFDRSRAGCWQIDDVAATGGWTLSLLLKYPD